MVFWDQGKLKSFSTTTVPMATKLDRMVTYLDGLLHIKLHDRLIRWSCDITWQSKVVSPLPQCLWPPNLTRLGLTMRCFYPWCYSILWWRGPMIPPLPQSKFGTMVTYLDSLLLIEPNDHIITWFCKIMWQTKTIISSLPPYLWSQNSVGWWLTWVTSTHKVTWPCNHVIL